MELFANIELMKAKFEQISPKPESSFTLLQLSQPQFALPYHFHSQFELTWIQKSSGKRYVGGNVANFSEGDSVKVIEGPFTSFVGTVETISEKGKVKVQVLIFGRPTPVELEFSQVEKV